MYAGMEQADLTGQRIQDLGHPYTTIIHSSMKRAIETAAIVHKHLPDLPIVQCDLLREGAPWPPEPPSRNWRPEYKVCLKTSTSFGYARQRAPFRAA